MTGFMRPICGENGLESTRCQVTAHGLDHKEAGRTSIRRAGRKGPLQLGWLHVWLRAVAHGGLLALVAMVLAFAQL
jgi:hypothetical protein